MIALKKIPRLLVAIAVALQVLPTTHGECLLRVMNAVTCRLYRSAYFNLSVPLHCPFRHDYRSPTTGRSRGTTERHCSGGMQGAT